MPNDYSAVAELAARMLALQWINGNRKSVRDTIRTLSILDAAVMGLAMNDHLPRSDREDLIGMLTEHDTLEPGPNLVRLAEIQAEDDAADRG